MHVLDSGFVLFGVPEKQGSERGSENGGDHLYVRSLRQTDDVHEVTGGEQLPLVAEASLHLGVSGVLNRKAFWMFFRMLVTVLTFVVLVNEQLDSLQVNLLDSAAVVHE